jgi:prepilin-type N-terminal cleavage/methylation domain-containing protein
MKKRNHGDRGFTLVEIAIVLVILGLIITLGAALIGPLTKRSKLTESREVVKAAKEAVFGYVVKFGYLPADITTAGARNSDAWGTALQFYAAAEINGSPKNACGVNSTTMQVNDCQTGTCVTKSNIAYVVYSYGEDINGSCTGTASPFNLLLQGYGYDGACVPNTTNPQYRYDDIVEYVSLDEIRSAMGCAQPLAVTSSSTLTQGEEDSFYSISLQAIGGKPPYTWTTWSGNGLTLNTTSGLISGTINYKTTAPNVGELSNCSETFTVSTSVTDQVFSPSVAYTGTISVRPRQLTINTPYLPSGTEGSSYPSTTLSSSGGRSSYTWSITSGSLPLNLSLNGSTGVISGTTTTAGTYNFVVQLSDTCTTVQRSFVIVVNPPASSSSSSTSSTSTSTSSTSSSSGGLPPTCTLSASPTEITKGQTSTLTWSVGNGPANGIFSPSDGTCTTFLGTGGGSCTTAALTASVSTSYTFTVSNANGSGTCSATIYTGYRVWNNTGSRRDFIVDGTCRRVNNNNEITTASLLLSSGETIDRYGTNNGTCGGGVMTQLNYSTAATADADNDSQVNFSGTDR